MPPRSVVLGDTDSVIEFILLVNLEYATATCDWSKDMKWILQDSLLFNLSGPQESLENPMKPILYMVACRISSCGRKKLLKICIKKSRRKAYNQLEDGGYNKATTERFTNVE